MQIKTLLKANAKKKKETKLLKEVTEKKYIGKLKI